MMRKIYYSLLIALLFKAESYAQGIDIPDSLQQRFTALNHSYPEDVLYVATDKDIYLPGETIWFAGYLLQGLPGEGESQPDLLAAALLREDSTAVSLKKNYLLERGLSPGSLSLPDSLRPGRYLLLATTNLSRKNGKPLHKFYRPLTIMSTNKPDLSVDFEVLEAPEDDSLYVEVSTLMPEEISRGGLRRSKVFYNFPGHEPKETALDESGHARIALARSELKDAPGILYTRVTVDRQEKTFNVRLPMQRDPEENIRIASEQDSMLNMLKAVGGDTIEIELLPQGAGEVRLAVTHLHSRDTKIAPAFILDKKRKVELLLNDIAKGTSMLSLLSPDGNLLSQRLFFAHYGQDNEVQLHLNKDTYSARDSVRATIELRDASGQKLGGIFTVSCVQLNRLEPRQMDLPSYFYSQPLIGDDRQIVDNPLEIYHNPEKLENLLHKSGAGSLLWERMRNKSDTLAEVVKWSLSGQIKYQDGKEFRSSSQIMVGRDSSFTLIPTDDRGNFIAEPGTVATPEDGYLHVQAMRKGRHFPDIQLRVEDPTKDVVSRLVGESYSRSARPARIQNDQRFVVAQDSVKPKYTLGTVHLEGKKDRWANTYTANECGDYVCGAGYLNCPAHNPYSPGNTIPVKGREYMLLELDSSGKAIRTIYQGCIFEGNKLQVYTSREFTGMDRDKLDNDLTDFYLSTLYWEAFQTATADEPTAFSFFTSDLTGTFKIIIEGIATNGDFISAEKTFRVIK